MSFTDDERLEQLAAQLRYVREQGERVRDAEVEVLAEIRGLLAGRAGTIEIGGRKLLHIAYPARFDRQRFAEVTGSDPALVDACSEVSATKAKAVLPPTLYAQCQVPAKSPTITLPRPSS